MVKGYHAQTENDTFFFLFFLEPVLQSGGGLLRLNYLPVLKVVVIVAKSKCQHLLNSILTERQLSCQNISTRNHFLHLTVNRHLQHSFPILLGSANATQTSHIKLHYKRRTVEEIIKKIQTLSILKRFSHIQNNSWYQIFFCAFLFAQVQENPVSLAQRYQKLKAHLIVLFLAYCFTLD